MQRQVRCPEDVRLCRSDVEKIYQQLRQHRGEWTCNSAFCSPEISADNSCDCLINKVARGEISCDQLYRILNEMTAEELKNQIRYNLDQLTRLKVGVSAPSPVPIFGTMDWWRENIWGYSRFQNFIYLISATLAFIGFFYLGFRRFQGGEILGNAISAIIATVLVVLLMMYIGLEDENATGDKEAREARKRSFLGILSTVGGILGVALILVVVQIFTSIPVPTVAVQWFGYLLLGLILAFNFYFAFLIPQLLILGVVIQKILTSNLLFTNKQTQMRIAFAGGIVVLAFLFFAIQLFKKQREDEYLDKCSEEQVAGRSGFVYLLPYLFFTFTLLVLILLVYYKKCDGLDWSLYLEPVVLTGCGI